MNREMQIIVEIDNQADVCYPDAVKLGEHAATVLKRSRSQLTGLETIAESTRKTSDIFDYIKRQTARNFSWRQMSKDSPNEGFGMHLKKYLETDLRKKADLICSNKLNIGDNSDEEQRERRRIHLLLMRQFIRQMVIQYEFRVNIGDLNLQSKQGKEVQKNQGNNRRES